MRIITPGRVVEVVTVKRRSSMQIPVGSEPSPSTPEPEDVLSPGLEPEDADGLEDDSRTEEL